MWNRPTQPTGSGPRDAGASQVDVRALNEMLASAFPKQSVVATELVSGGFANMTFKVSLSNSDVPVVVRVYVRDPSAAYREASILELVKEFVPVQEVLYVSPKGGEGHTYIVLRWIGGVPLDQLLAEGTGDDARQAVRATGSALAQLQGFWFPYSGFFGDTLEIRDPFAADPHTIVGVLEQCLFGDCGEERIGVALTQRLWQFVKDHEQQLGVVEHHSMLVHGDFSGPKHHRAGDI